MKNKLRSNETDLNLNLRRFEFHVFSPWSFRRHFKQWNGLIRALLQVGSSNSNIEDVSERETQLGSHCRGLVRGAQGSSILGLQGICLIPRQGRVTLLEYLYRSKRLHFVFFSEVVLFWILRELRQASQRLDRLTTQRAPLAYFPFYLSLCTAFLQFWAA